MKELLKHKWTLSRNYIKKIKIKLDKLYWEDYNIFFPIFNCHDTVSNFFDLDKSIFYNIDSNFFTIDKEDLFKKINISKSNNKIIYIVHYFWLWVDKNFDEILELAKNNNYILIEDCGITFWIKYKNKYLWTFWDIWFYSFRKYLFTKAWSSCIVNNEIFWEILSINEENIYNLNYKKVIDYALNQEINILEKNETLDIINNKLLNKKSEILNFNKSISKLLWDELPQRLSKYYDNFDWNDLKKDFNYKYDLLYLWLKDNKKFLLKKIDYNSSFPLVFPIKLNLNYNTWFELCWVLRKKLEKKWIFTRWFWSVPENIKNKFLNWNIVLEKNLNLLTQNYIFITLSKDFDISYYKNVIKIINNIKIKNEKNFYTFCFK